MINKPGYINAVKKSKFLILTWLVGILFIILACRFLSADQQALGTLVSMKVQQTQLALTAIALKTPGVVLYPYIIPTPGQDTSEPQATLSQNTELPKTEMWLSQEQIPNFERRRKAARILLFENMSASGQVRYVMEALERGGYFYVDVGSATGWFKDQLLSNKKWDLIIAAAEARREFGGEYFELINQHLEAGESAIIENWDLDLAPNGKVDGLLRNCGVKVESDWFEPEMRVFFWQVPDHPIFNFPNKIPPLTNSHLFWSGDVGDLMGIRSQSAQPSVDPTLLAVTNPAFEDHHATIVNCFHNRLILQTFSSHDYSEQDVINLWQNYIHYALVAKFINEPSLIPTPKFELTTADPTIISTVNPLDLSPQNLPGCEGILSSSLVRPALFQTQLFEHNAVGEFLIAIPRLENISSIPIQIWDEDYRVEGMVQGKLKGYPIQKAATGFLFIENSRNLWQDLIQPNQMWETSLAFDVDPQGEDWVLVITPGLEVNEPICQIRIPLSR